MRSINIRYLLTYFYIVTGNLWQSADNPVETITVFFCIIRNTTYETADKSEKLKFTFSGLFQTRVQKVVDSCSSATSRYLLQSRLTELNWKN